MITRNHTRVGLAIAATLLLSMTRGAAKPQSARPPSTQSAPAASANASEIARRVQAFYDKTRTFTAHFEQTYRIALRNKIKKERGQVYFEKPGKMSWRYTTNGNRVVSDGQTVWVYEKDNKQVIQQKMQQSFYPGALSFLMGGAKLEQSLDLSLSDKRFPGGYMLVGKPKSPTPAYEQVHLYVDAKTYHVRRVVLIDGQNNRNQFEFSAPKANLSPPEGEFKFKIPEGVTVVNP